MDTQLKIYLIANVVLLFMAFATANVCTSTKAASSISFMVSTSRNSTGHRHVTTDVSILQPITLKSTTEGNVRVDVQQNTCIVNNRRILHLSTTVVVLDLPVAPSGYEVVPGLSAYRMHLEPLTWEEARLACEVEGAHLAVLNSPEEAAALKGIFAKAPATIPGATWSNGAFIGISDIIEEGHFITIFGESLNETGYATWGPGEPNNVGGNQDCGAIKRSDGKLDDANCTKKAAYFCEYEL